ncbi:vomeronasal type-1 receptor 4-like [Ctenodactylus gundi]
MSCAQRNECYHSLKEILEKNNEVVSRDLGMGVVFLSQSVVGLLGNFSLLYQLFSRYHTESKLKSTDVILIHLFTANSLVILSKGLPNTMAAFGLKSFLNEFGCECLLYFYRVGRGVSVFTVCILSVFQNVKISPVNSCWKDLKVKAPKYIGISVCLCWILQIVTNSIFPLYVSYVFGKLHNRSITGRRDRGFCSTSDHGMVTGSMYTAFVVFPEVCFSVIMIWASGSMIFILHRHKQRVQHIHSTKVPSRSPESRATHSILLLASTFVSFYTLSSIFHTFTALFYNLSWWLGSISRGFSVCFPTVSPFLVMSHDSSLSRLCFVCTRRRNPFNLTRNT